MTRVAIVGCGATGTRTARQLVRGSLDAGLVLVDADIAAARTLAAAIGGARKGGSTGLVVEIAESVPSDCEVVVLAVRSGDHLGLAESSLAAAQHVVSVSDRRREIAALLALGELARSNDATLVIGAGMMPGLSDVLAKHGASWFDQVNEIHVSKFGTGGPDCARQHHRALKGFGHDWRDGNWVRRAGGSGRELSWFPPPVQAADCYRAALGDPLLLVRVHDEVERITARMAATRRDRLTMHLPMLRRPHSEGLLGAVRVELRGVVRGAYHEVVLGCAERPAVVAGAVASLAVDYLLKDDAISTGASGLAELVDAKSFLGGLAKRGLRPEIFVGAERTY